jgi:hypothetical protein
MEQDLPLNLASLCVSRDYTESPLTTSACTSYRVLSCQDSQQNADLQLVVNVIKFLEASKINVYKLGLFL